MDSQTPKYCPNCGKPTESETQLFCQECGTRFSDYLGGYVSDDQAATYVNEAPKSEIPMKWYKFVTNFMLIFGSIMNFISGVIYLLGYNVLSYDINEYSVPVIVYNKDFYSAYPLLRVADIIYGLAAICIAVLGLMVRKQLKEFKKCAPGNFLKYYIVGTTVAVLYSLAVCAIFGTGISTIAVSTILTIVEIAIFVWLNSIYFKKRSFLFVN